MSDLTPLYEASGPYAFTVYTQGEGGWNAPVDRIDTIGGGLARIDASANPILSAQELNALVLSAQGLTEGEISDIVGLAEAQIQEARKGVYSALGARTVMQAVNLSFDTGHLEVVRPILPRRLSARQYDVLEAYASGLIGSELGRQLDLSPRTAHHYSASLRAKLGARDIAHAVFLKRMSGDYPLS